MLHFMPVYIMKCLTYPEIYGNLVYPQKALILLKFYFSIWKLKCKNLHNFHIFLNKENSPNLHKSNPINSHCLTT